MSGFYEFAKYVDVLVLFFFIYAGFISLLSSGIAKFLIWFQKKWDTLGKKLFGYDHKPKD